MDFLEIARSRQSCRSYDKGRAVEHEKLLACLEAARLAPSACNAQPYHFTVATGELAGQIGACTRSLGMNGFTKAAPAFVVVSEEPYNLTAQAGVKVKGQDYRSVDIGIATAYFTAEAAAQGLATCILGWFEERTLQKLLNLHRPIRLVIAVGYAAPADPLRTKKRKTMEELTTWR